MYGVTGGVVVVVADGAGGIPGGGRAADLVLGHVGRVVSCGSDDVFEASSWHEMLCLVDGDANADRDAGETTAVIVAARDAGSVVGASCGDSGAVVVRDDATVDNLTHRQHRKRRLGSGVAMPVAFERTTLMARLSSGPTGCSAMRDRASWQRWSSAPTISTKRPRPWWIGSVSRAVASRMTWPSSWFGCRRRCRPLMTHVRDDRGGARATIRS